MSRVSGIGSELADRAPQAAQLVTSRLLRPKKDVVVVARVMLRCGPLLGLSILVAERCWAVILCGECSALDRVVGEDAVSAPGSGAGDGGEFGAVPAVAAFDVVDPAFGSGSPFDLVAEGSSVFELAARGAGFLLRAMATPRTPSSCRSSSTLASP